jgi:predicted DNA-binding transcriptional regulator YafY
MRESVALQTGDARSHGRFAPPADPRANRRSSACTARLRYRGADGAPTSRNSTCTASSSAPGRWYVVGHCHLRQGLRTLRLDRVAHAEITAAAFERPEGFDASAYLARAMATLPRAIAVETWLRTDLETARRELPPSLGIVEAKDGGVSLKGSADELEWYARELMRIPFAFEVRSPAALRDTLVKLARGLAERLARSA